MNNIGKFVLLAFLYFATGKLGLLLAVPPGYATAVWPPSGIAFAGLLVFGSRFWPSIWLGSFLVNIGTSVDFSSTQVIVNAFVPAAIIGFGAAMQAMIAAELVRRILGYPLRLVREGEVFKFLLLAGPLSCLVNSTIGVVTLISVGKIKLASAYFSWWTWWVGDCIGVLIFAPLLLMFIAQPREIWRSRRLTVGIPMAVTFILMVVLFVFIKESEDIRINDEFSKQAQLMTASIENEIERYLDILYSLQSFYKSSQSVERSEFNSFTQMALSRYRGLQAVEWDPKVLKTEREAFEKGVQEEGFPDFMILEMNANGETQKSGIREFYFPITFAEPLEENRKVLGFDFMSEKSRQEALKIAWQSGNLAFTKPIHLIQGPVGLVAFLGIYENNKPVETEEDRFENLKGFVVEILKIQEIILLALEEYKDRNFFLSIIDKDLQGDSVVFNQYLSGNLKTLNNIELVENISRGHLWGKNLSFGGRQWEIKIYPTADYFLFRQSWNMWFVLAGGLLFVGFLGGFLLILSGRESLVRRLINEGTEDLNQANLKLHEGMQEQSKLTEAMIVKNKELEEARLIALNIAQDAQEAQLRAAEAMKSKSEFTSMVSHELRTPLTVIKESVGIVYDETAGPINSDQKDFLETAKRNVDRLARLINDVLDYQKLEAHNVEFRMQEQDINDLLSEVGKSFQLPLKGKGLELVLQLEPNLPKISFDRDQITQVLTNYLNNAMKFTEKGAITIISEKVGDNSIKVSVKDSGIGIKEEDFSKLFQSFSQISTGMGRQTGGTGLGLILCKKIIEFHKGKVGVESVYGQGTTFNFILPIRDRRKSR